MELIRFRRNNCIGVVFSNLFNSLPISSTISSDALPGFVDDPPAKNVEDAEAEEEEGRVDKVAGQVHHGHQYHHHYPCYQLFTTKGGCQKLRDGGGVEKILCIFTGGGVGERNFFRDAKSLFASATRQSILYFIILSTKEVLFSVKTTISVTLGCVSYAFLHV